MKIALAQMKMTPEMEINYQKSIVSDYQGKTVAIAGRDEELLITEVNLSDATITRKKKPYISLRKPELYS